MTELEVYKYISRKTNSKFGHLHYTKLVHIKNCYMYLYIYIKLAKFVPMFSILYCLGELSPCKIKEICFLYLYWKKSW